MVNTLIFLKRRLSKNNIKVVSVGLKNNADIYPVKVKNNYFTFLKVNVFNKIYKIKIKK